MRSYVRFVSPAAVAVALLVGSDLAHPRSADAAPGSTQDVNIVSPLTSNGSVPVEATIKGIVKTRVNPALTHVGALASDIVTLARDFIGALTEVRSDGSVSTFTTVPSGKALVITDVEWIGPRSFGASYGQFTMTNSGTKVFERFGGLDETGNYSGKASWTTGLSFGPGTTPGFSSGNVSEPPAVFAHGYYVDAP